MTPVLWQAKTIGLAIVFGYAFKFAFGYLGRFIGRRPPMARSLAVALLRWRRQFMSDSRRALTRN
jgi:uncharacterized membrane protein